jgi:transposase
MSMHPVPWPEPDPLVAALIEAKFPAGKQPPLAVTVRRRLGEWLADEDFAAAFGVRGRPGWSPSRLALVTVLQMAENLTDRGAAEAVGRDLAWQYALGLGAGEEGFDHTVLSEFRARVTGHGLESVVLDRLLERLAAAGLVAAGGKQRTDSTHVVAAVAALNRLELAGESVRALLEALAAAHPGWLAQRICLPDFERRYGTPMTSWRPPLSAARRKELATGYARDGYALLEAVYDPAAPPWLREIPAAGTLRLVLLQNYARSTDSRGREVIRRREAGPDGDGLPPGHLRIASPYDLDARWGAKREEFWLGYKLHLTETCDDPPACTCQAAPAAPPGPGQGGHRAERHEKGCGQLCRPNLITHVATTDATVGDAVMTMPAGQALAARNLAPGRHYLDSGYLSAELVVAAARAHGITLVGPLLGDTSAQARAGHGYARADFAIDYSAQAVTCPQGRTSSSWTPCTQGGKNLIVAKFSAADCTPCPALTWCTTSTRHRRQLTLPPREVHEAQAIARAAESGTSWQADYARRAGIEGTIRQVTATCGSRRARYRGLARTRLEHTYTAAALNLLRLDAYWNHRPLDRGRTSHLARLNLSLAA